MGEIESDWGVVVKEVAAVRRTDGLLIHMADPVHWDMSIQ